MKPKLTPQAIVARTACRADLAGGTTDIWPLYLFHPGACVVNIALEIMTTCRITPLAGRGIRLISLDTRREDSFASLDGLLAASRYSHPLAAHLVRFFRPEAGFVLETHSEAPAGAGISGSSALMIATTAALARLCGEVLSKEEIRAIAQNVEAQLIRVPTGCQDYYPALYGGVGVLRLDPDGVHREAIDVSLDEVDRRYVLAYTGAPRQSGINNWKVFKAHIDGSRKVFRNFERIGEIARAMHSALSRSAWDDAALLLREEWKLRRTNAPAITTPLIDRLIAVARRNGGLAGKVCGAGGGGCVIFQVEPDAQSRVERALAAAGAEVLPFAVCRHGLTVDESRVLQA